MILKERAIFDYSKLRGRIVEKYGNIKTFSKLSELGDANLNFKLK